MNKRYRITPRAFQDLVTIASYTAAQWGTRQRDTYLDELERCFEWLADHPQLGRERPEICPAYRSYPQGQHVVFYVIRDAAIDIIGIPHQAMDIETYFGDE